MLGEVLLSTQNPQEEALAALLLEVIPLAMRVLRTDLVRVTSGHGSSDVTLPQLRLLANLWIEPTNMKGLASMAGMSLPAASRMIKLLHKQSLVETSRSVGDGREVQIRLSRMGKEVFLMTRKRLNIALNERLKSISDQKSQRVQRGLITLREILNNMQLSEN